MTGEIINLRQARKQKARAEKVLEAQANRLRFGQTKASRERSETERLMQDRRLDGARRRDGEESES